MSHMRNEPHDLTRPVAALDEPARVDFLHRTYQHLALAILAFAVLEAVLLRLPGVADVVSVMIGSRLSWFIVLAAFMGVSTVATRWASSAVAVSTQYLGLAVYVVAEAVVFLPLLYMAARVAGPEVIPQAALITGVVFGGLTATVLVSKADLTFLGGMIRVAGFGALAIIGVSLIFGVSLGTWFAAVMVVFAAGAVLYETSNVLHNHRADQHVAASLALFASVALLFWYVLSILSRRR
jgi:FtsH-binding integral membrane protein